MVICSDSQLDTLERLGLLVGEIPVSLAKWVGFSVTVPMINLQIHQVAVTAQDSPRGQTFLRRVLILARRQCLPSAATPSDLPVWVVNSARLSSVSC